jgi:diphthine synthase
VVAGTLEELLTVDFGAPLHSFVLPGKMHILEAEMLETFAINKETFKQHADIHH